MNLSNFTEMAMRGDTSNAVNTLMTAVNKGGQSITDVTSSSNFESIVFFLIIIIVIIMVIPILLRK